jgi:plasmid stability protein
VLRDLEAEATYMVRAADSTESRQASGRELLTQGLAVSLPEAPAAAVIFYRMAR